MRGGQGGHGAAFDLPDKGKGAKLGRTSDGDFALPEGGGRGGRWSHLPTPHNSLHTTHCSLLTTCSVVLEVDTSLQDLLHLHGRPLVAANRGADSAGQSVNLSLPHS